MRSSVREGELRAGDNRVFRVIRGMTQFAKAGLASAMCIAMLLVTATPALAHVGSPDIYADGNAGPYKLFVTIRPPLVIPGVAEIEVRADPADPHSAGITGVEIAPIPLTGEASKHPPVADAMKRSAQSQTGQDGFSFTGGLWIMASGSWQVRFRVTGSGGTGVLSIPVPATSSSTKGMQAGLGILLGGLGLLLVLGVVGIVGAAVRDAQLPPGAAASNSGRKRAAIAMAAAQIFMIAAVILGDVWWRAEASDYAHYVYKPLTMQATVGTDQTLDLKIEDPGWLKSRKIDDLVLDHEHLMHLYLLREPDLDVVYHLHPDLVAPGDFSLRLPSLPAGNYKLYADVVHATGFPETLVASLTLPKIEGRALMGDDAKGTAQALSAIRESMPGSCVGDAPAEIRLADGYVMRWDNPEREAAKTPEVFQFSLLDAARHTPEDMALYMGMQGHAAFVKDDGSVFAHVHPSGTVSMAALMMAEAQNQSSNAAMAEMPEMAGEAKVAGSENDRPKGAGQVTGKLPNTVGFPYGFPTPGAYRIFVQMKHGSKHDFTIETGAFDACAL